MAVVDIFLACGQSNMEGQGDKNLTPSLNPSLCWEFNYETDTIIALADGGPPNTHNANTGSLLPEFAKAFTARSARPALFIRCAKGGSALLAEHATSNGDWSPTGTWFPNAITRAQATIAKAIGAGHTIGTVNVLWHQGEADCREVDDGTYEAAYAALVSRFRTALNSATPAAATLQVFAARIGLPGAQNVAAGQEPFWDSIRAAQVNACSYTPGLHMTYLDCVTFFERNWMKVDQTHYTQNGYNDMGRVMGAYAGDYYDFPPPTDPEGPTGVTQSPTSHAGLLLRVADRVLGTPTWAAVGEYPYIVPSGVTSLPSVEVYGCSAGSGSSPALNSKIGGGSGGGGRAHSANVPVTPGETLTIKVGAPGAAGVAGGAQPTAGAETGVFRGATPLVRVASSSPGTNASGAATAAGGAGGVATHGDTLTNGSPGANGTSTLGSGAGGNAAGPEGGAGGAGVTASVPGNQGAKPGGGASGGRNGGDGAAGQPGRVKIAY